MMKYLVNRETKEHYRFGSITVPYGPVYEVVEADDEGWIKWEGGECPVRSFRHVEFRCINDSYAFLAEAGDLRWELEGNPSDIGSYRPILPETSKPEPENAWPGDKMKFTKLTDTAITPSRGTPGSAGLDLHADQDMLVHSGAAVMVGTGIAIEIPQGHVGLVCIRSSVGKAGVALANSIGIIDADYRGEIKLCLTYTAGSGGHYIRKGNAVAQLVVVPIVMAELVEVDGLTTTDRGAGGFGSTGK